VDDIIDIKVLAELKAIFDRFAIDGQLTAPEVCQVKYIRSNLC
jgi:hypothetical protein